LIGLKEKAKKRGLNNIKIINTNENLGLGLKNNSIDAVLLYDILHYFKKDERKKLYHEIYQILKPDSLLSVYPKHTKYDFPWDYFKDITLDEVKEEITNAGFSFQKKYCGTILHDKSFNDGCVLNFKKRINMGGAYHF